MKRILVFSFIAFLTSTPAQLFSQQINDPAYKKLEEIQIGALRIYPGFKMNYDSNLTQGPLWDKIVKSNEARGISAEETLKHFNLLSAQNLPTKYEDPQAYYFLKKYVAKINRTLAKQGKKINWKFGTRPDPHPNASAHNVDDSDVSLIVFNRLLDLFSHEMAKSVAITLDVKKNGNTVFSDAMARKRIEDNPLILSNFADVITSFLAVKSFDEVLFAERQYAPYIDQLRNAMMIFILAHEHAHIIFNHKSVGPYANTLEIQRSWHQELQADHYGIKVMATVVESELNTRAVDLTEFAKSGAVFMLSALNILERARNLLCKKPPVDKKIGNARLNDLTVYIKSKGQSSQTKANWKGARRHPPGWMRIQFGEVNWQNAIPKQMSKLEHGTFDIGKKLITRLEFLWKLALPQLKLKLSQVDATNKCY